MSKKVTNISQASEIIAHDDPIQVTLSSGAEILVDDIPWPDFRGMWDMLGDTVRKYIEHHQSREEANAVRFAHMAMVSGAERPGEISSSAVDEAQKTVQEAFSRLAEKLIEAPEVAVALIKACTGHDPDGEKWKIKDVVVVAQLCIRRNFIDSGLLRDFLGVLSQGSESSLPAENEAQDAAQA